MSTCLTRLDEFRREHVLDTITDTHCKVVMADRSAVYDAFASKLFPGLVLVDHGFFYTVTHQNSGLAVCGGMRLADAFNLAVKLATVCDWTAFATEDEASTNIPRECQEFCKTYRALLCDWMEECYGFSEEQ